MEDSGTHVITAHCLLTACLPLILFFTFKDFKFAAFFQALSN